MKCLMYIPLGRKDNSINQEKAKQEVGRFSRTKRTLEQKKRHSALTIQPQKPQSKQATEAKERKKKRKGMIILNKPNDIYYLQLVKEKRKKSKSSPTHTHTHTTCPFFFFFVIPHPRSFLVAVSRMARCLFMRSCRSYNGSNDDRL